VVGKGRALGVFEAEGGGGAERQGGGRVEDEGGIGGGTNEGERRGGKVRLRERDGRRGGGGWREG